VNTASVHPLPFIYHNVDEYKDSCINRQCHLVAHFSLINLYIFFCEF